MCLSASPAPAFATWRFTAIPRKATQIELNTRCHASLFYQMSSSLNQPPQRHNLYSPLLIPSIIITDESEDYADDSMDVLEEVEIIPRHWLSSYFPRYTLKRSGVVLPDERPPVGQSLILGLQHVLAMFGSTVLAPLLMGFDTNSE